MKKITVLLAGILAVIIFSRSAKASDVFVYDALLPTGASYTVEPYFSDGLVHDVTLYSSSSSVAVSGMVITAVSPGSAEVYVDGDCEGCTFFVAVRDADDIFARIGDINNANNLYAGLRQRIEKLKTYPGDPDEMVLFAGDCYLDERLYLTDFDSRFADLNVYSAALSGSTAQQWCDTMMKEFFIFQPKALVLSIGMNDLRHGKSAEYVASVLEKLFDSIRVNMPDTTVYWWKLIPHIGFPEQQVQTEKVNAAVSEYAQSDEHIIVVDTYEVMTDENAAADLSLYRDTLHPNSKGYDLLFQKTYEAGLRPE